MSKRFTATEKWDKSWFCKLTPRLKCLWFYIIDKCDTAGIWDINFELASFCIGEKVYEEDMSVFGDKVEKILPDKFFIKAFVSFQYGELSDKCKPHLPIIEKLKRVSKGYSKGIHTLQEKEKDKDKDKEKEREGMQGEGNKREEVLGNLQEKKSDDEKFNLFWEAYPKRKSKGQAEKAWLKIKPSEQLLATMFAKIEQAKTSEDWIKEGGKYIPYPATWLNAKGWKDEYKTAVTQGTSKTAGNWALLEQRKREREKAGIQT